MQALRNQRLHPNLPRRNRGSNPTTDNQCFFVIVSVDFFFWPDSFSISAAQHELVSEIFIYLLLPFSTISYLTL